MDPVEPRPITQQEIAAIREAFAVAAVQGGPSLSEAILAKLHVVCRCPCGCASVGFVPEPLEISLSAKVIADAEGLAPNGESLGFMVWGTPEQVTSIEVYWVLTEGAPLPAPGSLRPYAPSNEQ